MKDHQISSIGVVGAGQMGAGIAQVFAQIGKLVRLVDVEQEQLRAARQRIDASAKKLFAKGVLSEEQKENVFGKIFYSTNIKDISDCDVVIEAVNENKELKKNVLLEIDTCLSSSAILASNTSSISITWLQAELKACSRFIGLHFMNPVPIMDLVEIVPGMATDSEVVSATEGLVGDLGKQSVRSRDFPGFIVNRLLMPMINEAFVALSESVGKAEDIDSAMKLGTRQPMGPLELADFIGLDTCLAIMEVLFSGFKDQRYRPSPLLIQYVDAGRLGRKTGRGVYQY